ncbi:MAG: hypothetical protein FD175_2472 [Beijerinckiaceae bacterium]|nr:MAG: hypothetical protein FD175_2472 [Beijerinckiaceae bacterium]
MCQACGMNPLAYNGSTAKSAVSADMPQYGGTGANFWASQGATGNTNTNGVLSGSKWGGTTLTYSFPTLTSQYDVGYGTELTNGFLTAPEATRVAIRYAMNLVSQYTNLTTTEVDPAVTQADVRVAFSNEADPTAYAYYPADSTTGGDIWYGNSYASYKNPVKGQYAWATTIHELGHSLGLKHGHQTGGVANTAMQAAYDQMAYSIMTYKSYENGPTTGYTNETNGYAQTFMMYDIAALQVMYGANFNTNSGNTTYTWSATTGEMFINGVGQGAPGGNRVFLTVWDGNGIDTYDFSNYTTNMTINLAPGAFSITSSTQLAYLGNNGTNQYAPGNIFNALQFNGDIRSLIENANGGSGNDSITGNIASNQLNGGAGNDSLWGQSGNDILIGGAGSDALDGGADWDLVSYSNATAGVVVGLSGWVNFGDAAGDTFWDVEGVLGSNFDDVIGGNNNGNTLYGENGADTLFGYAGNDYLEGGAGADMLYGGEDNDILSGGGGADAVDGGNGWDTASYESATSGVVVGLTSWVNYGDAAGDTFWMIESLIGSAHNDVMGGDNNGNSLYGRDGADTLFGYDGADALFGETGSDQLFGGGGNDILTGGAGADALDGGSGWDMASYDTASAGVTVGMTGWVNYGDGAGDTFWEIEALSGSAFNDALGGTNISDALFGRSGGDTLFGYGGDDALIGGIGNDILFGGTGADTFIFYSSETGNDTIKDFEVSDNLDFRGFGYTNAAQALGHMTQQGADVLFSDGSNVIRFENTQLTTLQGLSASHWLFS